MRGALTRQYSRGGCGEVNAFARAVRECADGGSSRGAATVRAVVCHDAELAVRERPEPVPRRGQVRIEVLRCGICGSDLHARHGVDVWAELAVRAGYDRFARSQQEIVFGHEFCGEVAEHGPGCREQLPAGTRVVALPLLRGSGGVDLVGLSAHAPGAYAEQLLVEESLMMPVPNGLGADVAALTEPMAVAWHAVRRGEVGRRTVAVVVGCGPIGLAVILLLKAKGVRTVVASDYSPARRALAGACGADVVLDPAHGVAVHRRGRGAGRCRTSPRRSSSPSARARNSAGCRSGGGTRGGSRRCSAPCRSTR